MGAFDDLVPTKKKGTKFDDLIPAAKAAAQPANYNPTGISALDGVSTQIGGALDGLQHHLQNLPIGIAQGASHLLNSGIQGVAGGSDYANGVQQRMAASDAQIKQRENDYQARTAGNAGSYVGAAVGEVAPWAMGLGEARAAGMLPELGRTRDLAGFGAKAANVVKKTLLAAGEGSAMGLLAPVTGDGIYADQKMGQVQTGAEAGGLLHLGGSLAGAGLRLGARTVAPWTATGSEGLANERVTGMLQHNPNAEQTLRSAPQLVGGETPTMAQALPGDLRALQAERALRNNPHAGPEIRAQDDINAQARTDATNQLAGGATKEARQQAMQDAKTARFNATDPYYKQLPGVRADPTNVLSALDSLQSSGLGQSDNVATAIPKLRQKITSQQGPDGMMSADVLSGLHANAGTHLGPMATAQEKRALGPVRDEMARSLDSALPGFSDNLAAFAAHSQPVNDLRAAGTLADAIDRNGPNASGNQVSGMSQVRTLLNRNDRARFPMSQSAETQMDNVLASHQRSAISDQKLGTNGSDTEANNQARGLLEMPWLRNNVGKGLGTLAGGLLGHLTGLPLMGDIGSAAIGGGAGSLLDKMAAHADAGVMRQVGQKAGNAQKAAEALQAYRLQQARQRQGLLGQLPGYLLPYGAPQIGQR